MVNIRLPWGKILGAIFGFIVLGPFITPILGLIIGLLIGHSFDKSRLGFHGQNARIRQAFFEALFVTMGRLAKLDGRVTQNEIEVAKQVMQHMQLNTAQRAEAIRLFNQGKQNHFDVNPYLVRLRQVCYGRRNLLRMFMQLLFQSAYADGDVSGQEQQFVQGVANNIGFTLQEFQQMQAMFAAQFTFRQQWRSGFQQQYQRYQQQNHQTTGQDLKQAYAVLGVREGAPIDEVKKAYRKLMNQYHPDKLVAKGLPEEMMKSATEKTQQIKQAYEVIKDKKG